MNLLESQLQYPLGETLPAFGATLELQPGVRWVRMPLPFALDHINLWLLRDRVNGREGWTVVDCGVASQDLQQYWEQVFAHELDGLPILRVLVTHMHPDHVGLAAWLCERWQAPLLMSLGEYASARLYSIPSVDQEMSGGEIAAVYFQQHGITDSKVLERIRRRHSYYSSLVPLVPRQFDRLQDGDHVCIGGMQWEVIVGYGHAPEHVSLYCAERNLLISGDMVLPRISTNVSVYEFEPNGDTLRLYLQSLDRYEPLPEDVLVLPSHGKPFQGLHTRIEQQREHHAERLAEVMTACSRRPCSAADIVPIMFPRDLDLHQMTFALGEALAHLHYLYFQGRLCREEDAQGVLRFAAVP